jgi:hypothetical protein
LLCAATIELFLRRVIIDQKLPFEIAALDEASLIAVTKAWEPQAWQHDKSHAGNSKRSKRQKRVSDVYGSVEPFFGRTQNRHAVVTN